MIIFLYIIQKNYTESWNVTYWKNADFLPVMHLQD